MLEAVLMRAFMMLYANDSEADDDCWPSEPGKCQTTERRAFTRLSSVCCGWYQTLVGWPESPTPRWVAHQLEQLIERKWAYTYTT